MADAISRAKAILREFKGDTYAFGFDVMDQVGPLPQRWLTGRARGRKQCSWGRFSSTGSHHTRTAYSVT